MEKTQPYYAIAYIETGLLRSTHISLSAAAENLVPGTCWGAGPTRDEAKADALAKARELRLNGIAQAGG